MLVIKLIENTSEGKFRLFKKKKNQTITKKEGFICCNEVFSVVEVSKESLDSAEFKALLNRYSGAVIFPKVLENNEKIKKYLFDAFLYYSRAYLSAITVYLKANGEDKVCVYIDNFRFCREWVELAGVCRSLVIMGAPNAELKRFCEFCRVELGLVPQINDDSLLTEAYVKVNLNNLNIIDGYITLDKGKNEVELYPNARYFAENENVKKLVEMGIAKNTACAAVQVVPFKKIYLNK